MKFPSLPEYGYSWRSVQIEPIPHSGERITLGAILKGDDGLLIAAKLVPAVKIKSVFGKKFGGRIADALVICMNAAEKFYCDKPLTKIWTHPMEGFFASQFREAVADNIEDGLMRAARNSSSLNLVKNDDAGKSGRINPGTWRKEIFNKVMVERSDFKTCFEQKVSLSDEGVPLKFGFISSNYVAHFDTIASTGSVRQNALVRAQSKLWQLDQLRDSDYFPCGDKFELVLHSPEADEDDDSLAEFIDELKYEASRKKLSLHTANSSEEAAKHVIECAA